MTVKRHRFVNRGTGVVVAVDEATASTLGPGWEPKGQSKPERKASPVKKSDETK